MDNNQVSAAITFPIKGGPQINYTCPYCDTASSAAPDAFVGHKLDSSRLSFLVTCNNLPRCGRSTLVVATVVHEDGLGLPPMASVLEVHPTPVPEYHHKAVPKHIAVLMEEALRCAEHSLYQGAAVVGRATLEATMKDKSATGHSLEKKIDSVVPAPYNEIAHHIRIIGNEGAHEGNATKADVIELLDFVDLVLDQIYVTPARVQALSAKRQTEGKKTPKP